MAAETAEAQPQGFYSTTSGTYFSDKDSLAEHYKSDFHKYNLKRKVAGLPPVTKEWFDSRKELLSSTATVGPVQKIWYDPLTKKKFSSENTYEAHVNSKKYKDLLKKTGQEVPAPVVSIRQADATGELQPLVKRTCTTEVFSQPCHQCLPCRDASAHKYMQCCTPRLRGHARVVALLYVYVSYTSCMSRVCPHTSSLQTSS